MGEVSRARDTRLKRDVALKIVPESFASDADRLARFQREAEVLASLNHPNIAAIYGLEEAGGVQALVLELVDGETLAERIASSRLDVDDALTIARQIAEALEAAHGLGIVHRDLKPANIKIRPDGTVKVLDFGLAKMVEPSGAASMRSTSPTITTPAITAAGIVLGTAAYMSPEQAKGYAADKRSDVWAFGCVLYEMLTGRRAFEGDDASDTLAAVLRGDPDWNALPPDVPAQVQAIIRGCLQKNQRERIPEVATIRFLLAAGGGPSTAGPASSSRTRRFLVGSALLGTGAAIAATILLATGRTPNADSRAIRFTVPAPPNTSFGLASARPPMSLSPDGRQLALVLTDRSGVPSLWLRAFDSVDPLPVPGTEGAAGPFWSPDGRFIGFFANDKLKKVAVSGGAIQTICEVLSPGGAHLLGGTWNRTGTIVFGPASNGALLQVSANGGQPRGATSNDQPSSPGVHRFPHFLPDDRHFLYMSQASSGWRILASSLDSTEATPVIDDASMPFYSPPGFLVFVRQGTVTYQRFDPVRRQVSGEAVPFAENVSAAPTSGLASFTVSAAGVLAFSPQFVVGPSQLTWFDRAGKPLGTVGEVAPYLQIALSPDERQIAAQRNQLGSSSELWLIDASRGVSTRLTSHRGDAGHAWSPDGRELAYFSFARGLAMFHKPLDGAEQEFQKGTTGVVEQWTRDHLIYLSSNEIRAMPLSGDRKSFRVTDTPGANDEPQLSPDGRWLAYYSNELGSPQIWVQPFPGPGVRQRVSTNGGNQPKWRGDGKELFYLRPDGMLMTVDITPGPTLEVGAPRELFKTPLKAVSSISDQYAVTRDGQRFLSLGPVGETTEVPVTIVVNWAAGLADRR
jgi:serine/threonine protein kinase/Tol biopolymer transport system component